MSVVVLSIDSVDNQVVEDIKDCLYDNGIDVYSTISVSKKLFDFVYEYIRNSAKIAILIGNVDSYATYLKNRLDCKTEKTIFGVDGVKWVQIHKYDRDVFVADIVPKLSNNKTQSETYKFCVYNKSTEYIHDLIAGFKYSKSVVNACIVEDNLESTLKLRISSKLDPKLKVELLNRVTESLLDCLYSVNGQDLIHTVTQLLRQSNIKIALAESYTAGGVSQALASIQGASNYLVESVVCYSNTSKAMRLGLDLHQLQTNGAVNENVAYEMAANLATQVDCDLVLATTGYASDCVDANGRQCKAGRCYLAIGNRQGISVFDSKFEGTRSQIVQQGIQHALFRLYQFINK
jgi:PncC family amidohydrolase